MYSSRNTTVVYAADWPLPNFAVPIADTVSSVSVSAILLEAKLIDTDTSVDRICD
jgi:hypothetical protein